MTPHNDHRFLGVERGGRGWLQRALLALVGIGIVVVGFVFITIALIATALLVLAIGARWWWVMRKVRAQVKASEALEGEYTVVERAGTAQHLER